MEGHTFGMSDFQPLSPPLLIRATGGSHQTPQNVESSKVLDGSLAASSHDPQQIRRSLFEKAPLPISTITLGRNHPNTSTPSPSSRENQPSSHSGMTYTDLVSPTSQVIRYRVHNNVSSSNHSLCASDPLVSQVIHYSPLISQPSRSHPPSHSTGCLLMHLSQPRLGPSRLLRLLQ
eukprot:TRINITY_DN20987_c0_g1_i1.p1 TRINITY_DN20987_c0_g1~~TRINITY_DN20987_c0_g1_i1.p1  ORF type:complete len:176 (-),score=2.75 TRINITY_DN20987_c0_g1_i1:1102-1629(-)